MYLASPITTISVIQSFPLYFLVVSIASTMYVEHNCSIVHVSLTSNNRIDSQQLVLGSPEMRALTYIIGHGKLVTWKKSS